MHNHKGLLIVISGFSGAGKGTVVKEILNKYDYALSISSTTRKPRINEVHGQHYFFLEKQDFEDRIKKDLFLEWAEYCNNYYGTPKDFVYEQLEKGKDVLLEIEVQGALKVKEQYKDAILIFITAPNAKELENRLLGRGTETLEVVKKRMNRAYEEINMIDKYDYIVVNDDVQNCAKQIHNIITVEHLKVCNSTDLLGRLSEEFNTITNN